jgi:hypothetical protein
MTNLSLAEQLAKLAVERTEARQQAAEESRLLRDRRESIWKQLLSLQQDLDAVRREQALVDESAAQIQRDIAEDEVSQCVGALRAARDRLSEALAVSETLTSLAEQRDRLLAESSTLAGDWADFNEFEANKEASLAALPEYHRSKLLSTHEQLRSRVQELIDLEERIQQVTSPVVSVECVLFHDPDSADLSLVTPVMHADFAAVVDSESPWQSIFQVFMDALFDKGKQPQWDLVEMEPGVWAGFMTIRTLAEYSGEGEAEGGFEKALQQAVGRSSAEHLPTLHIELAGLHADAWHLGGFVDLAQMPERAEVVAPEVEPEGALQEDAAADEEVIADVSAWYTKEDLVSWRRSLKVSATSKWNQTGRVVRTMLMRMIAGGHVGDDKVAIEQLWRSLPEKYVVLLTQITDRLIDEELLVADTSDSVTLVAVSPDSLDEVQNLVNRTVSAFWEPLLVGDAA